jgi:hypothetical protein
MGVSTHRREERACEWVDRDLPVNPVIDGHVYIMDDDPRFIEWIEECDQDPLDPDVREQWLKYLHAELREEWEEARDPYGYRGLCITDFM